MYTGNITKIILIIGIKCEVIVIPASGHGTPLFDSATVSSVTTLESCVTPSQPIQSSKRT